MRLMAFACSLVLVPAIARARTAPNPEGRALPVLIAGTAQPAAVPARAEAVTVGFPVPLPEGAVQLDSTYYDLQDLGSLGTRIATGPDGRVHVVWEDDFCDLDAGGCPPNVNAPQPYPQRAMGYAWRDVAGAWTRIGKVRDPGIGCTQCLPEHLGGHGALALTADGRAAVSQHMNEDGCGLRGDFYLENSPGGATWTAYLTPIQDPVSLFPQVLAMPNGSFVIMGEVVRPPPQCLHCGVNGIRVSRLASAGATFVCPTGWQSGPWVDAVSMSMFRNGYAGFPSAASASDGRVGIAVTDFGGNAWLIESADGSFGSGTTIRNLTGYLDSQITSSDSTSNQYRPYINCGIAYNDTTPNIVWAEVQARRFGSSIFYFDHESRVRHWDSKEGLSTVRQVQPGEADSYDNVDNGYVGPIAGFNTISVDWPQVGFSPDGSEIIVAWVRFVDSEVDTSAHAGSPDLFSGVGYGDIVCSVKRAGSPWSEQQNLTGSASTDDRYPAIPARNLAGRVQLLFQAASSSLGGVVQGQDRGTTAINLVRRIAYLERPLAGSVLAVSPPSPSVTLRAWPNPSRGRVRFALGPGAAGRAVLVHAVSGALVARVPLGPQGEAEWDGRDSRSRALASGVYLARVEGSGAATKLLFLR